MTLSHDLKHNDETILDGVSVSPPVGSSDHNSVEFHLSLAYYEPCFTLHQRFSKCDLGQQLDKYNRNVEKNVVVGGGKQAFYRFLNHKLKVSHRLPCLRKGDKIAVLEVEKANLLADKFCDVFSEDINETPDFERDVEYPMNTFPWFTEITIYEIIKKWPTSYSVTPDFIPTAFIKNIAHVIAAPIAYIFNQSLAYGEVPLRWKHSFITPLLKKEPATEVDNYRP
ncbi:hypothetical protein ANCDUO_16560, partial [Ancylostoma duodenale]